MCPIYIIQPAMSPAAKTTIAGKPIGPVGYGLMGMFSSESIEQRGWL